MTSKPFVAPLAISATLLTAPVWAVEINPADGGFRITADTYEATVDAEGNFSRLEVDGVPFLATREAKGKQRIGGDFPGDEPAQAVTHDGDSITAKRGDISVTYTFDDKGFTYVSKGGAVDWGLSEQVRALVSDSGVFAQGISTGNVQKMVAGDKAVALDKPFHIIGNYLLPSALTRGTKGHERYEARVDTDVTFDRAELLSPQELTPTGQNPSVTQWYKAGETPSLTLPIESHSNAVVDAKVKFTAVNHPHGGKMVFEKTVPVSVPAGEKQEVTVEVPVKEPGMYWVTAKLMAGDEALLSKERAFIYDGENFKPELTRPSDFEAFWDEQLTKMREIPFDVELTERPDLSNDRFQHYDVALNNWDGDRIRTVLRVPRSEGPHQAEVASIDTGSDEALLKSVGKYEKQKAGPGMWQRGGDRVRIGAVAPEASTYLRWDSREDNNTIDSYLTNVRMLDYLRSRDDVSDIFVFGASRTGASMLAAAALAPEKVAAVNVHVPTSTGLSWKERPYRGWGSIPSKGRRRPRDGRLLRPGELRARPDDAADRRCRYLRRPRAGAGHPGADQPRRGRAVQALRHPAGRARLLPLSRASGAQGMGPGSGRTPGRGSGDHVREQKKRMSASPLSAGTSSTPRNERVEDAAPPSTAQPEPLSLSLSLARDPAEPAAFVSPAFEVEPSAYYRLALRTRTDKPALWAVQFEDAAGRTLAADHYNQLPASDTVTEHVFYFQAKDEAATGRLRVHPQPGGPPVEAESAGVTPVKRSEVARWADAIYETIPPLDASAVPRVGDSLPRTMQRLREGGRLRVVMLGDSIINDTGNSAWDVLVERQYPGAEIDLITAVRSGTGAWHYREEGRVESYVLRHRPDLLIIGGISHRDDVEAIRDVIRQVREQSDPEILVCTGPVGGKGDPREDPNWTPEPDPAGDDFRVRLRRLAEEEGVAFLDMQTLWRLYIRASDKLYSFFLRDDIHANTRGRQVLARIMEHYFAPEDAE